MQWSLNSNAVQQTEFEHEAVTITNNKRTNIIFCKDHTEFAYYFKVEFDLSIQGGWTWKPISIEVA